MRSTHTVQAVRRDSVWTPWWFSGGRNPVICLGNWTAEAGPFPPRMQWISSFTARKSKWPAAASSLNWSMAPRGL